MVSVSIVLASLFGPFDPMSGTNVRLLPGLARDLQPTVNTPIVFTYFSTAL